MRAAPSDLHPARGPERPTSLEQLRLPLARPYFLPSNAGPKLDEDGFCWYAASGDWQLKLCERLSLFLVLEWQLEVARGATGVSFCWRSPTYSSNLEFGIQNPTESWLNLCLPLPGNNSAASRRLSAGQ